MWLFLLWLLWCIDRSEERLLGMKEKSKFCHWATDRSKFMNDLLCEFLFCGTSIMNLRRIYFFPPRCSGISDRGKIFINQRGMSYLMFPKEVKIKTNTIISQLIPVPETFVHLWSSNFQIILCFSQFWLPFYYKI